MAAESVAVAGAPSGSSGRTVNYMHPVYIWETSLETVLVTGSLLFVALLI